MTIPVLLSRVRLNQKARAGELGRGVEKDGWGSLAGRLGLAPTVRSFGVLETADAAMTAQSCIAEGGARLGKEDLRIRC